MDKQIKTIVITGSSDGIGLAAARMLKAQGHNVVVVGRSVEKSKAVAAELSAPYHIADYAKLSEVVHLADELSQYPSIDVLCNNAGAVLNKRSVTEDGFERTFQINVLAGFLLTNLLSEKLCKCNATVIQTSSIASNLLGQGFSLINIQNESGYNPIRAYGESKLCDVLFMRELNRRFFDSGMRAVAFEPGVPRSNFACEAPSFIKAAYHTPIKYLFTCSTEKSAKRLLRLALGIPQIDFKCGETYSYKKPYAIKFSDDGTVAAELWNKCEEMTEQYLGL